MSNRRRPERRDAHGKPVRSRREIAIAVLTVLGVLAVTAILVVTLRIRPKTVAEPFVSSSTTAPAGGSTTPTPTDATTSSVPSSSVPSSSVPASTATP